jgi:Domain of unknown function (DUF4281)
MALEQKTNVVSVNIFLAKSKNSIYIDIVNIDDRRKNRTMNWPTVFSAMNMAAMLGWLVLLLAPRRWQALSGLPHVVIPGAIALLYSAVMAAHFAAAAAAGGGFNSIAQVRTLFASDPVLVAGWGHYLAFDLLVGCWLAERLDRAGVSRWLQAPVLFTTFMFGPAGWLLGMATEAAARWGRATPANSHQRA